MTGTEVPNPWLALSGFERRNLIPHIVGGESNVPDLIERVLCPSFLGARLAGGEADHDLLADLDRAVAAAARACEPVRLFRFGLLQALWRLRATSAGAPGAAALQAALGRPDAAVRIALAGGVESHPMEEEDPHREFVRLIGRLGEADAGLDFASRFPPAARTRLHTLLLDGLAQGGHLDLCGEVAQTLCQGRVFGPFLAAESTCRRLARMPAWTATARFLAGSSGPHVAAVGEGWASYNGWRALAYADRAEAFELSLGGEPMTVTPALVRARVLAAFVLADPTHVYEIYDHANRALGRVWRDYPHGLLVARALAGADPDVGVRAVGQLADIEAPLARALAWLHLGAASGGTVTDALLESGPVDPISPSRALPSVCAALGLLDFGSITEKPYLREASDRFVDHLLAGLRRRSDSPSDKRGGGPVLGEVMALAGDRHLDAFYELVRERWSSRGLDGRHVANGVAKGLARRDPGLFLAAVADHASPLSRDPFALMVGAEAVVSARPEAVMELLDQVSPRDNLSRGALAGVLATARPKPPRHLLERAEAALGNYSQSSHFRNAVDRLTLSSENPGALRRPTPPPAPPLAASMPLEAVARILSTMPDGGTIEALRPPLRALLADPHFAGDEALLERAEGVAKPTRVRFERTVLCCALALELPAHRRATLLRRLDYADPTSALAARQALAAENDPGRSFAAFRPDADSLEAFHTELVEAHTVRRLAARSPHAACRAIATLRPDEDARKRLISEVSAGCRLDQAEAAVQALEAFVRSRGGLHPIFLNDTLLVLAERLAAVDPAKAVLIVQRMPDSSWGDTALVAIARIGGGVFLNGPVANWSWWAGLLSRIGDASKRADAAGHLLDAWMRSAPGDPHSLCAVMEPLGRGPAEAFIAALPALAPALQAFDPQFEEQVAHADASYGALLDV